MGYKIDPIWYVCENCGKIEEDGEWVYLPLNANQILKILVNRNIVVKPKSCEKCKEG